MNPRREVRQIRHSLALATSAGVFAAFVGGGSWIAATRIESGLERQARSALDDAGIVASIRFHGRDAELAGNVPSLEDARRAAILVADLPGTRRVDSQLRVGGAGSGATAPTSRPPAPTTSSPTRAPRSGASSGPAGKKTPGPMPVPTAAKTSKAVSVPTGDILFDTGQISAPADADPYLKAVSKYLAKFPGISVHIEGHSDNIGSRNLNKDLSARRAEMVARRLVALGVDARRLNTEGFADTRPVASNRTAAGRAANRRVEIVFEGVN
jgi:outer membrane protein OmpA-like peptidoglycan-associated protein